MEKVNIKPFLSGDRVYYVGPSNDLPKNTVLIVDDCYKTDCGCDYWLVNIKNTQGYTDNGTAYFAGMKVHCKTCKLPHILHSSLIVKRHYVLRPAQELNAPLMTFTKVAEVEKEQVLILN